MLGDSPSMLAVPDVKVSRSVIAVEHPDHDAEEAADLGHRLNPSVFRRQRSHLLGRGARWEADRVAGAATRITAGVALALLASVLLGGCQRATGRRGGFEGRGFEAQCTRVVDGDTLHVDHDGRDVTVRLEGIDAPERGEPFNAVAREFLSDLALDRRVEVLPRDRDRHGRLVARVVVEGRDTSEALVAAGLAWHYTRYAFDPRLAAAQEAAQRARAGVWSLPNPRRPDHSREPGKR